MMDRLTYRAARGAVSKYNPCTGCVQPYTTCRECMFREFAELLAAGKMLTLPCVVGDTIYDLCKCDDGEYRIFPMVVVDINAYGALRRVKDREPSVYNIYAETDYTYLFASFYDIGKTIFITRAEAEAALKERESE